MTIKFYSIAAFIFLTIYFGTASAMGPKDLERLKSAGVGNTVIEAVEKEKIIETCALTIDDIITLNNSGYSDQHISAYIYHRSFKKNTKSRTYQNFDNSSKITEIDIEDLEYLKEIGFSDDLIKAIVMNQDPSETDDRDMILRMFGNMGIMIEAEKNRHERYKRPRPR